MLFLGNVINSDTFTKLCLFFAS